MVCFKILNDDKSIRYILASLFAYLPLFSWKREISTYFSLIQAFRRPEECRKEATAGGKGHYYRLRRNFHNSSLQKTTGFSVDVQFVPGVLF